MNDLVAFLRLRLDEDEQAASGGESACWHIDYCDDLGPEYHDRFDPARVLAEVEAKRRLIARGDTLFCECDHADDPPMDPDTNWTVPLAHHDECTAYRIAAELATVYRHHPDYRDEWRPFSETDTASSAG